ncbi:complement factor D-like [Rhinatrema bivittatum]|uniref:complement factor D-like n=1 Tax=Rhinatrema bivittatum TaxID=194408 RepID=UPI0011262F2E|nr:complement factor D-like [Rhinatrema bivittatum]
MGGHNPLGEVLVWLGVSLCVAHPRGRILGGSEAKPHLRPYMASLHEDGKHLCGGFLIADQWVLSAAHCRPEQENATLQVLLGAHSLSEPEPSKHFYQVLAYFLHPGYNDTTAHNDLLLLKLREKVALSQEVKILPFQKVDKDLPAGTICDVAGWGQISLTGKRPDKLQEVTVQVIGREICNQRDQYDKEITENMICAGARRKDSCEGDSGGPLVCNGMAEGVVSIGYRKCGNAKKPGVYTRISAYVSWINGTMTAACEGEDGGTGHEETSHSQPPADGDHLSPPKGTSSPQSPCRRDAAVSTQE